MTRYTDKFERPDYDYFEDSIGDAYGDYDELDGSYKPPLSETETDMDETEEDNDESEPKENTRKNTGRQSSSEFIPYPTDAEYGSEKPWQNYGETYKYTQQDLIELMDRYHNGTEEDKKYVRNQFCIMLTPMIKSMIRHSRGIDSEYLDYIQHCYMYVVKRLERFDPTKSFVFNYFKYVIHEGITACNEASIGKTSHSTNIDRKVKKAIRKYENMNTVPSPSLIANATGLTVPQVEDSIARINGEKLVLSDEQALFEKKQASDTPLDVLLRGEVTDTLRGAIDNLPQKERAAILLYYNFNNMPEDYTNKQIAKLLHVHESKVKELLDSAKRHLKRDFSLDQLLGKTKRLSLREGSVHDKNPATYSFVPDCDDYQLDDTDNSSKNAVPKKEVIVIDYIVDISFQNY